MLRHTQKKRGRKPHILPEGWSRVKDKNCYKSVTGIYARNIADLEQINVVIDEQKAIIHDKTTELATLKSSNNDLQARLDESNERANMLLQRQVDYENKVRLRLRVMVKVRL